MGAPPFVPSGPVKQFFEHATPRVGLGTLRIQQRFIPRPDNHEKGVALPRLDAVLHGAVASTTHLRRSTLLPPPRRAAPLAEAIPLPQPPVPQKTRPPQPTVPKPGNGPHKQPKSPTTRNVQRLSPRTLPPPKRPTPPITKQPHVHPPPPHVENALPSTPHRRPKPHRSIPPLWRVAPTRPQGTRPTLQNPP